MMQKNSRKQCISTNKIHILLRSKMNQESMYFLQSRNLICRSGEKRFTLTLIHCLWTKIWYKINKQLF